MVGKSEKDCRKRKRPSGAVLIAVRTRPETEEDAVHSSASPNPREVSHADGAWDSESLEVFEQAKSFDEKFKGYDHCRRKMYQGLIKSDEILLQSLRRRIFIDELFLDHSRKAAEIMTEGRLEAEELEDLCKENPAIRKLQNLADRTAARNRDQARLYENRVDSLKEKVRIVGRRLETLSQMLPEKPVKKPKERN